MAGDTKDTDDKGAPDNEGTAPEPEKADLADPGTDAPENSKEVLDLLEEHAIEALFIGHVHNFWYERFGEAELYMLPSTAFLRHDFSEFGKSSPGFEFGRGEVDKFGNILIRPN